MEPPLENKKCIISFRSLTDSYQPLPIKLFVSVSGIPNELCHWIIKYIVANGAPLVYIQYNQKSKHSALKKNNKNRNIHHIIIILVLRKLNFRLLMISNSMQWHQFRFAFYPRTYCCCYCCLGFLFFFVYFFFKFFQTTIAIKEIFISKSTTNY